MGPPPTARPPPEDGFRTDFLRGIQSRWRVHAAIQRLSGEPIRTGAQLELGLQRWSLFGFDSTALDKLLENGILKHVEENLGLAEAEREHQRHVEAVKRQERAMISRHKIFPKSWRGETWG